MHLNPDQLESLYLKLRSSGAFPEVPPDDLRWFIGRSVYVVLEPDEHLVRRGEEAKYLVVILSGVLSIRISQGGSYQEINRIEAGTSTGLLPYSRMTHHTGDVVAIERTEVLRFPSEQFDELISHSRPIVQHLVNSMTDRVKFFTQQQLLSEKLASLGKLSAGLAHELNNPAAAIARSASELSKHLSNVAANFRRVVSIQLEPETAARIESLVSQFQSQANTLVLSALQRNQLENEMLDWLDAHRIDDADLLAPVFVESSWTPEYLQKIHLCVGDANFQPVLEWLAHVLVTYQSVHEIQESARRINELVQSVKRFTHMDQSYDSAQTIDLHSTLVSTLTMLKHPIKSKSIKVVHEFDSNPVEVSVHPGEISQVWTNLIDNAVDAMPTHGILLIKTQVQREFVKVTIQDNGKGIPPDIQSLIFDPFFTTKEPGKGTGMGLDLARRIVLKYRGEIRFRSQPGETVFDVYLPISTTLPLNG